MSTDHHRVKRLHHAWVAPTTRLGRWAVAIGFAPVVGLAMLVVLAAHPWGAVGVVLGIGGMITAPIVAIVAMFQGERLASVYLAFALPLLVAAIVIGHPLFIND